MIRALLNMFRNKLIESGASTALWGEAIRCYVYELNRCPSSALENNATPSSISYGQQDLNQLRTLGFQAWYSNIPRGGKLDASAKCGAIVGYCAGGYSIWSGEEGTISSIDVRFGDERMNFQKGEIKLINERNQSETYQRDD